MAPQALSPKQVARAIGVSEASLKRWCDKGLLPSVRTAGGHRRLPLSGVMEFLRQSGHALVRPEILGLPSNTGKGEATLERAREPVRSALEEGDEEAFSRVVLDLFLASHPASAICDKVIAPALHEIGDRWQHGKVQIYEERRATETCMRTLRHLRRLLPPPRDGAPIAIGGTLSGDSYAIPTTMVELSLREAGWNAEFYGTNLPPASLSRALERVRPQLLWLSVSAIARPEELVSDFATVYSKALSLGIPLVVGGQALVEDVRRKIEYSAHCDTLAHLVSFARTLQRVPSA